MPEEYVLIVDDEQLVAGVLCRILTSGGMRVTTACCAEEALEYVQGGHPIDLAILDYLMPGMDGLSLLSVVRQHRPRLPCILLTGYGVAPEELRYDGCVLLYKPITAPALLRVTRQLLESGGDFTGRGGLPGAEAAPNPALADRQPRYTDSGTAAL